MLLKRIFGVFPRLAHIITHRLLRNVEMLSEYMLSFYMSCLRYILIRLIHLKEKIRNTLPNTIYNVCC